MQRKALVGAVSGLSVVAVLAATAPARAARNDILVSLATGNLVAVTLNGVSGVETTRDGAVSLETDAPFCVPQPEAPCSYLVNSIKVRLTDFVIDTDHGPYTFGGTYALMRGPFNLVDTGNGVDIPLGTAVEIGADINGSHVSGLHTSQETLTQPLTLLISPVNGVLTLDGTLPFSFFVGAISEQFTGTIAGMIAGNSPFTNTAPFANAGPNVTVTCPQLVQLSALNSADRENNINQFAWNFFGPVATSTLFGQNPSVFAGPGVTVASLNVIDAFGGLGRAQTTITVNLPPPTFAPAPPALVVSSCAAGSSAIPVPVPIARVCGSAVQVTGTITAFNGATVSIPVVNGTVNVPPGAGTIQFVASNANGAPTMITETLTVLPPPSIFGAHGVTIDDGSSVGGSLFSGAGGLLTLQNDVSAGSVFSLSPVVLKDRVIAASIDTNAGVTPGHSDTIGAFLVSPPTLPPFPALNPVFTGGRSVTVNPTPQSGSVVSLAPGQYGVVTVYSRGRLILSGGAYDFTSLDLEPQAQLVTTSAVAETTQLFVRDSVTYRGSTVASSGQAAPLFLGYTGTAPATMTIEAPFAGTVVAPRAQLNLQSLNGTGIYTGEFFANSVVLSPHTTVNSNPFTCTVTCVIGCQ